MGDYQSSDLVRQDGRGFLGLSRRLSGTLQDGWRAGERAVGATPGRMFPARRPGGLLPDGELAVPACDTSWPSPAWTGEVSATLLQVVARAGSSLGRLLL